MAVNVGIRVALKLAKWCAMQLFLTIIVLGVACFQTPMPDQRIPDEVLVMRESFQGPGPERTGNWRGWFDVHGCWWESHNTWLVVTDEVLIRSPAFPLHWNAPDPDHPWFCLSDRQLVGLNDAVEGVEPVESKPKYSEAVDRWTVVREDGTHALVKRRGYRRGGWEGLTDYFDLLSSIHVWGQSPEQS